MLLYIPRYRSIGAKWLTESKEQGMLAATYHDLGMMAGVE